MSDKETKERIEKEADGATSERPKAWNEAIDAAIEMMKENPIGLDAIDEEYLERLEALKHQQP